MSESPNSSACLVSCYQAFSLTSELITTQHCAHRCHPSPPIIWLKGLYRLSLGLGGNPCGGKRGGRQSFLTYLVASSKLADLESLGFIGSSLPTARCSQPESSHLHTPTNSSDHFICRPSSVETPLLDSPMASPFLVTLGAVCSQ